MTLSLGQKIRAARLERRLTQEQLAGVELSKSYVSELERGHRTPRLATLKILAGRLRRPLSFFLEGATEDQEPEAYLMVGLAYFHAHATAEAAAWLKRALDAASDDDVLHARIELALACVDQRLGQDLRAWRRVERALPVLARSEDRAALVRANICLGRAKLAAGDPASAAWTFEAALGLLPAADADPSAASALYYYRGIAQSRLGQPADAEQALHQGVEAAELCGDPHRGGMWHLRRAVDAAGRSAFDAAIRHAGEAIAVYDVLENRRRLADLHWTLGDFEMRRERWKDAQRHYLSSVVLYGAVRRPSAAARTLGYFIEALDHRMPAHAAHTIAAAALAVFPDDAVTAATVDEDRAATLWLRGTMERVLGKSSEARSSLTESLRLFEALRRIEEVRNLRRELALLAVESNDLTAAREHLSTLHETFGEYQVTPEL